MGTHEQLTVVPSFESHPSRYRHWHLNVEGRIATLTLDVKEENGLRSDYELKQNSYDLGVDIELSDALERLRFEYPSVNVMVFTSAQTKVFCAGANIRMLASSTHAFKVNFCRFTNETRCAIEDASVNSGIRSIAACNGTAAGGGYELALAADEIWLIDDGSSAVSLPEVPLLGVLPGTGGLTRLVDKRPVRRDVADLFCTKAEGLRARDALKYRLIDGSFPRSRWADGMRDLAVKRSEATPVRGDVGIRWAPLTVHADASGRQYRYVSLALDPAERTATLTVRAPSEPPPGAASEWLAAGVDTWSLAAWREVEDALFHLRFTHDTLGLVLIRTEGDASAVLAHDAALEALGDHWLAREIRLYQARVLRRIDNTARSFYAIIDAGSCFAGSLLELALAADRSYMLDDDDAVRLHLSGAQAGRFPMSTGLTRLQARFVHTPAAVDAALARAGEALLAADAVSLGLVTVAPDAIDWDDELRIAVEERVSLSPDALTGMEQNLRFVGRETCDSKVFGRLSAWQNWIFQRPNAVGDSGALTLYGHPTRAVFDWRRT